MRPISGKVTRKVNLLETSQDFSYRPPAGRSYLGSGAPNGARYSIQASCAVILYVLEMSSFCSDGQLFALDCTIAGRLGVLYPSGSWEMAESGTPYLRCYHAAHDHFQHGDRHESSSKGMSQPFTYLKG